MEKQRWEPGPPFPLIHGVIHLCVGRRTRNQAPAAPTHHGQLKGTEPGRAPVTSQLTWKACRDAPRSPGQGGRAQALRSIGPGPSAGLSPLKPSLPPGSVSWDVGSTRCCSGELLLPDLADRLTAFFVWVQTCCVLGQRERSPLPSEGFSEASLGLPCACYLREELMPGREVSTFACPCSSCNQTAQGLARQRGRHSAPPWLIPAPRPPPGLALSLDHFSQLHLHIFACGIKFGKSMKDKITRNSPPAPKYPP